MMMIKPDAVIETMSDAEIQAEHEVVVGRLVYLAERSSAITTKALSKREIEIMDRNELEAISEEIELLREYKVTLKAAVLARRRS